MASPYPPGFPPPGFPPSRPSVPPSGPPVPHEASYAPARLEPVAGTSFGLVYPQVRPGTSGPAVGSLVAGVAAVLVALVVTCFGLAGAQDGWGGWVAGAFAVLAVLAGLAAIGLGVLGARQVRRARVHGTIPVTGRGLAVAGLVCGASGIAVTLLALIVVLVIQAG